jgi:hypothetical protein
MHCLHPFLSRGSGEEDMARLLAAAKGRAAKRSVLAPRSLMALLRELQQSLHS